MISKTDQNYLNSLVAQITPPEVVQLWEKKHAGWGTKDAIAKDELEAVFNNYCEQCAFPDIEMAVETFMKDFALSDANFATLVQLINDASEAQDVIAEGKKGDSESAKDFKQAAKKVTSTWRFKKVGASSGSRAAYGATGSLDVGRKSRKEETDPHSKREWNKKLAREKPYAKDFKQAAKKVTSTWRFKKVGKEEQKNKGSDMLGYIGGLNTKKEETEVNELSKGKLVNYITKASNHGGEADFQHGKLFAQSLAARRRGARPTGTSYGKSTSDWNSISAKRNKGVNLAARKLGGFTKVKAGKTKGVDERLTNAINAVRTKYRAGYAMMDEDGSGGKIGRVSEKGYKGKTTKGNVLNRGNINWPATEAGKKILDYHKGEAAKSGHKVVLRYRGNMTARRKGHTYFPQSHTGKQHASGASIYYKHPSELGGRQREAARKAGVKSKALGTA